MIARIVVVLLTIIVIAAAARTDLRASTVRAEPRLIDTSGIYSLRTLGYSDLRLTREGTFPAGASLDESYELIGEPIQYLLPAGAAQGPDVWYVIHLHVRLVFSGHLGRAAIYAMPNSWTAALMQFTTDPDREPMVESHTLGLIDGLETAQTNSRQIELNFANYLPAKGVLAGLNDVQFLLRDQGAGVEDIRVFADTSIEVTSLGPARLDLPQGSVFAKEDPGREVEVHYSVRNLGGRVAKNVTLEALYQGDQLRIIGEPKLRLSDLRGSETVSGILRFQRISSEPYGILLRAQSDTGGVAGAPVQTLVPTRSSHLDVKLLVATLIVCVSGVAFVFAFRAVRPRFS